MLYEGKAKRVYQTEDPQIYRIEYKDDATAFNGAKKGTIENKGIVNNLMSAKIFELLEEKGIKTHFIRLLDERQMFVKAVRILPLEVIIRNFAAGSISQRLGVAEGTELKNTVLEFCYKNDELNDPLINNSHITALGLATEQEIATIEQMTFQINQILIDYFKTKQIQLVDFKLEFGYHKGEIILADEISPDTCRLWDINTKQKLDKDRFRRDLGQIEEAYQEMLKRVQQE